MHTISIDTRTEEHMTVEIPPDPLPPVLQQYPLPRTHKPLKGNLLDCDSDDDDSDDEIVDTFTLLAILESQKEAQTHVNRSIPTVINVNKKGCCSTDNDSPCIIIDPSVKRQSPVSFKGDSMRKHASDGHIPDGMKVFKLQPVRHFNVPEIHREGCI